jgi:hypothetical protein
VLYLWQFNIKLQTQTIEHLQLNMSNKALEVLEAEFVASLEPLSIDAQRIIYTTGWGGRKSPVIDIDPIELVTRPVGSMPEITFNGQNFYAEVILGLPLNFVRQPQILKDFRLLIAELNKVGERALYDPAAMEEGFFVSNDNTTYFIDATNRLNKHTNWQIELVPATGSNGPKGLMARVIVPQ